MSSQDRQPSRARSVDALPTTSTLVLPPRTRSTTLKVAVIAHSLPPGQASDTSTTPGLTRVVPTLATPAPDVDLLGVLSPDATGGGGGGGRRRRAQQARTQRHPDRHDDPLQPSSHRPECHKRRYAVR